MPTSKGPETRYRLIDECLQRRQKIWSAEALRETVIARFWDLTGHKLSRRQFAQDLADMREGGSTGYNAPIAHTRYQGYHYTDPTFRLHASPLETGDAAVLRQALAALRQFQGLGLSDELGDVVQRVEGHLQTQAQARADEREIIWFEQVPDYVGTPWLAPLYRAIGARQAVRLCYRPFAQARAEEQVVQPQVLKEFNRRWLLLATVAGQPGVTHFALDRIEAAEPLPAEPYEAADLRPDDYFRDVVGASVPAGAPVQEIRLLFRQGRGHYVRTKPLHPSQQLHYDTGDTLEISLRLRPNRELETLLLSFGEALEVLAPAALRQQMRQRLLAAGRQYEDAG